MRTIGRHSVVDPVVIHSATTLVECDFKLIGRDRRIVSWVHRELTHARTLPEGFSLHWHVNVIVHATCIDGRQAYLPLPPPLAAHYVMAMPSITQQQVIEALEDIQFRVPRFSSA